ncbi:hypothetical protein ABZ391_29795, partial [Kitasatospora cineracea]
MAHDSNGLRSGSAMPLELLRTPPPKERADAARNRAAVLEAAARLFAEGKDKDKGDKRKVTLSLWAPTAT